MRNLGRRVEALETAAVSEELTFYIIKAEHQPEADALAEHAGRIPEGMPVGFIDLVAAEVDHASIA